MTKQTAPRSRHYAIYALITLLMVGAMLAWQVWTNNASYRAYHQHLSESSVNGAADELELLLSELQRSMRLFADEHIDLFEEIHRQPENEASWMLLEQSAKRYFPEYFGMILTGDDGELLRPDFDQLVGELCQQDIHGFLAENYNLQGYIHPNPLGYHFDIMVPWGSSDALSGVFFLSFPPDILAATLQRIQPPGHELMLLRSDRDGLIEVTAEGTRTQLEREYFLGSSELSRVVARRNVGGSRWQVVDISHPALYRDQLLQNAVTAALIFLAFAAITLLMLQQLHRRERQWQAAEQQAQQHRADLAHIDRLNTMGEMASSLAHELNQPLAAISTYCQAGLRIMENHRDLPEKLVHTMQQASIQAQRAGQIIRQMRRLAGKGVVRRDPVDLNSIIRNAADFLDEDLKRHHVTLTLELDQHLPRVRGDDIQIEQVLLNLLRNAIDAMQGGGGIGHQLTVTSMQSDPDTIRVTVSDNGPGMDEATISKIFDTFYSGRKDGMGLGLSISRSIIEAHGGQLWARSRPGNGASFFFTLPRTQDRQHGDT